MTFALHNNETLKMSPIAAHVISFWWRQCIVLGIAAPPPPPPGISVRVSIIIRFGVGGTLNSQSPKSVMILDEVKHRHGGLVVKASAS